MRIDGIHPLLQGHFAALWAANFRPCVCVRLCDPPVCVCFDSGYPFAVEGKAARNKLFYGLFRDPYCSKINKKQDGGTQR